MPWDVVCVGATASCCLDKLHIGTLTFDVQNVDATTEIFGYVQLVTFCKTLFQIERTALPYGPDDHSCVVLCNVMTGSSTSQGRALRPW